VDVLHWLHPAGAARKPHDGSMRLTHDDVLRYLKEAAERARQGKGTPEEWARHLALAREISANRIRERDRNPDPTDEAWIADLAVDIKDFETALQTTPMR
jgi:hypothetical protein